MASDSANEGSFSKRDEVSGVTTTDSYVAVTWDFEGDTTLNFQDIIIGTVFVSETGSSNGITFTVEMNGCEIVAATAVAAGAVGCAKISGYIGTELQVKLISTSAGNAGTATVKFFGK